MTQDEMKDLQHRFYEAINAGDLNAAERLVSPIYREHGLLPPDLSPDRDGVMKFFQSIKQVFPDARFEVVESSAKDDRLQSQIRLTGLEEGNKDNNLYPNASGTIDFTGITRIDLGMLFEHWDVPDQPSLLEQLDSSSVPVTGEDEVQED
jgi:predicted SnoaL-like aldol condensation-catalyzing enzyme